ncbi:MAG: hypothetical protein HOV80_12065 [Polyangiaceae bacterium]|nr:hypothetical protein [Polyangiaceae bacterium]
MTAPTFDPAGSELTIETKAVGMLAKLAHDLSIAANDITVSTAAEGDDIVVTLRAPVGRLEVRGVRKGTSVDEAGLSKSDKTEIQRKIREEVLKANEVVAKLSVRAASLSLSEPGKRAIPAKGTVAVGSRSANVSTEASVEVTTEGVRASGRVRLDLPALGITPPKGPLGAFKVHETVEIVFRLAFASAPA